jgi:hypothetical protein
MNNTLSIEMCFHDKFVFQLAITRMPTCIVVQYKSLSYDVPLRDYDTYKAIIHFLLDRIDEEATEQLTYCIDFLGYWPKDVDKYGEFTFQVLVDGASEPVFSTTDKDPNFHDVAWEYLEHLLFMSV